MCFGVCSSIRRFVFQNLSTEEYGELREYLIPINIQFASRHLLLNNFRVINDCNL